MIISCALIGYGYWGPNIARAISKIEGVNLTVICDQDRAKLDTVHSIYPNTTLSQNIDSVINNPNIDAIIIATPANTHFEIASKALKHGKHILVEKPLTISVSEAKKLESLNKTTQKIIMVGHTFEYNPAILRLKKIINDKSFGNVFYAYSTRVNLGQIRGDVNALWNLAPHDISILNYLFESAPAEVLAVGAIYLQKGIEDVVFISLRYPNNKLAQIHVSWLNPSKERKLTLVGSRKMLIFDDIDNEMPIKIYDKRADTADLAKGVTGAYKIKLHSGDIYIPQIPSQEPLLVEIQHFFDCIKQNTQPLTDIKNGMNVVSVLEACQKSIQEGNRWVKI